MTMLLPIQTIIAETAAAFGVPALDLISERRIATIVVPRHVAMTLARDLTLASYPRIARAFRRADHSTVIHAEQVTRRRLASDPVLAARVTALRARLEVTLP